MNGTKIAALFGITLICCAGITLQTWDTIRKENSAFAEDCNDRGGVVIFGAYARQHLDARPAASRAIGWQRDREVATSL